MIVIEVVEAVDAMLRAVVAWIAVIAAVATLLGYGLAALVWCACRAVRRGTVAAMAWRGLRKPSAPASRPQGPDCDSSDAGDAPEPPETRTDPSPSWAQTDREAA